ncbi:MAG: DUF3833 domain-containing protein [Pseudomonadota bacterium]
MSLSESQTVPLARAPAGTKPTAKSKTASALALVAALAGCGSQSIEDYSNEQPKLDIRTYLSGPLSASGIVFDRAGKADLRFVADITGTWEGNTGTLDETFRYSDGRTDERIWTITFSDDKNFTATAGDVVGEAVGIQDGNTVNMSYVLRLPRGDSTIDLDMDDWLYLNEDGTLINRTLMSKFGVRVGELFVTFRKLPE